MYGNTLNLHESKCFILSIFYVNNNNINIAGPPNTRTITSMCLRKRSLMIREGSVSSLEGKRASSESPQCGSMLRKSVGKIKQGIKT